MGTLMFANFNSIKVRLERDDDPSTIGRFPYFNSIKVRLELIHRASPIPGENFNSIKVRLELRQTVFCADAERISIP